MIKPELYKRTTDILYQAYFNDTLMHGNCCACAVGNIVSANCGYGNPVKIHFDEKATWPNVPYPGAMGWATVFCTSRFAINRKRKIIPQRYLIDQLAKEQIDATGYTWQQLARIEHAFEMADQGLTNEDWMFNGLVAVLEVLKDIHQVTDQDLLTTNNNRFKEQYQKRIAV